MSQERVILHFQSPDRPGIIAEFSGFIFSLNGNILSLDQYSSDPPNELFFMRVEFILNMDTITKNNLKIQFSGLSERFKGTSYLYFPGRKLRMGIFVSKPDHCLLDLLYHWQSGELSIEIPFILSNHADHKPIADQYHIPFQYIAAQKDDKKESEILNFLGSKTDFLVLARYMQILSGDFLTKYGKPIINIHHSFLPSFKGANPYLQAHERGVKLIGATAHYVTENLDAGPIIEQQVERISHRDNPAAMSRIGKTLEKMALLKAVQFHADYKIMQVGNRTIIF